MSERVGARFQGAWNRQLDRNDSEVFFSAYVAGHEQRLEFFEGWLRDRGFGGSVRGGDPLEVLDELWA